MCVTWIVILSRSSSKNKTKATTKTWATQQPCIYHISTQSHIIGAEGWQMLQGKIRSCCSRGGREREGRNFLKWLFNKASLWWNSVSLIWQLCFSWPFFYLSCQRHSSLFSFFFLFFTAHTLSLFGSLFTQFCHSLLSFILLRAN